MRVAYSTVARADLFEIGSWIAQDNPGRAESFVDDLEKACESLSGMPRRFQLIRGHKKSGVRRYPYGNYLIFYTVRADAVQIVRVLHGARDWERLLFPEAE